MIVETALLQDYSKHKLLEYADSFRELADSFLENMSCDMEGEQNRKDIIWNRQLSEQRSIFAGQLKEVSQMIEAVAEENCKMEYLEEKKFRQIVKEMKGEGILISSLVFVQEKAHHRICSVQMRSIRKGAISTEDVAGYLSVLLDIPLIPWKKSNYYIGSSRDLYLFYEEPVYHILTGSAKATKETEKISGDNFEIFEYGEGNTVVLLSDGMGSGEQANQSSGMVIDFMQRFLDAGFSLQAAVQMINGALITGKEEIGSSTLDCCNIDLYQGICKMCKVGAAPSFLKRDNMVEQISSHNFPLGLVGTPEMECQERILRDGDYIILLSDGIFDAMNRGLGEGALSEIISRLQTKNPGELANDILRFVLQQCRGQIKDDMTVLVTGIWERRQKE